MGGRRMARGIGPSTSGTRHGVSSLTSSVSGSTSIRTSEVVKAKEGGDRQKGPICATVELGPRRRRARGGA